MESPNVAVVETDVYGAAQLGTEVVQGRRLGELQILPGEKPYGHPARDGLLQLRYDELDT